MIWTAVETTERRTVTVSTPDGEVEALRFVDRPVSVEVSGAAEPAVEHRLSH